MALQLTDKARKDANLRLLHRTVDKSITDILSSATHVVLYNFNQAAQSWEKTEVEGSMFMVSRASGYLLVILNRNSPQNYPIVLSKDIQVQHNDPYLIFRQQSQPGGETSIRGIWFPNPAERVDMHSWMTRLLDELKRQPVAAPAAPVAPVPPVVDESAALAALLSPVSLGGGSTPSVTSAATAPAAPVPAAATTTNQRAASATPSLDSNATPPSNPPTLDKKSLQLALLSLIQDDRFLDLLHAQYLKVARARSGTTHKTMSS
eukprot:Nitzschia sp. Nitz4//scaffold30_size153850//71161//71949//NITZ4_002778-RA/size153850-processed-gene-0.13-mRNA-1//1//CDS//3329547264//4734//frame0